MDLITCNLSGRVRRERIGSREYLVAPVTMIVPGVLSGNKGPILYSAEENARSVSFWNGVPLVLNHPQNDNGEYVSARTPDKLSRHELGRVLNARVDEYGRLGGEAWFDEVDTRRLAPSIISSLLQGTPIEISTGLVPDTEDAPEGSVHNSSSGPVPYTKVAKNYRPDHLAVLVEGKGACSLKDGCGILANAGYVGYGGWVD